MKTKDSLMIHDSRLIVSPRLFVALVLCCFSYRSPAVVAPEHGSLTNIDKRITGQARADLGPERTVALNRVRARIPDIQIDFDEIVGSPKWIRSRRGFLTSPRQNGGVIPPRNPGVRIPMPDRTDDRHAPVKEFLDRHADLFEHGSEVLNDARITGEFVSAHNGLRTIVWQQQLENLPVFQSALIGHITAKGELVNISSSFVPGVEKASKLDHNQRIAMSAAPPISARQAVVEAAKSIGDFVELGDVTVVGEASESPGELLQFAASVLSGAVRVQLGWLPMGRSEVRLCWQVELRSRRLNETFLIILDAQNGEDLFRECLTKRLNEASYHVYQSDSPSPFSPGHAQPSTSQPAYVQRGTATLSALSQNASPNGWINVGDSETVGNNVDAHRGWAELGGFIASTDYAYRQYEGAPDVRPSAANRIFSFPLDLQDEPREGYADAAVVQLFYWCNWMHDRLYDLGFTEEAFNFQFENFSGGTQGDPVLADAQDSFTGNNAWMTIPYADGVSPRMEMFLFDGPQPDRDVVLDTEVVLHEYTHGLSVRRVAKQVAGGMGQLQAGGLGEGWSDFMALALLSEPSDNIGGNYAAGAYVAHQRAGLQENYYYGHRRYPYTTDISKNPLTFKDIDPAQADPHDGIPHSPNLGVAISLFADEVHNIGEVWCVMLWEMRASLISSLGYAQGNSRSIQIVIDGMNLAPPNPTFVQARDAILQAYQIKHPTDPLIPLWTAFAKRGLGYSAASPSGRTTHGVVEAFDLPPASPELWTYQTGGAIYSSPAIGPDNTLYFGSVDGKLYALNNDGTKKWEFASATNGSGGYFPIYSSPAVGPDGSIYVGSYDKKLYAIHPDGTLKWSYTAGNVIFSSPAIGGDGAIYFGCYDSKVYALNSDGTLRWTFLTGGPVYSSPAIDQYQIVYVGSTDNKLYAINPNGTVKWTALQGDWVYSSPAIDYTVDYDYEADPANGRVYYGSDDGNIVCLRASDGAIIWSYLTEGRIISSPVVDIQGNVYACSEDGKLYSLTPGGALRWSYQAGDIIHSSPVVGGDGRVYFAAYDRTVYGIDSDGTLLSSFLLGGEVYASPVIGQDGRIYVGSLDSRIYCFPSETLLAASAWPMFRNDARHLANQGFLWFDGGALLPALGKFTFGLHSTVYSSIPFDVLILFEWSANLIDWNFHNAVEAIDTGEGLKVFYVSSAPDVLFYRAKSFPGPYPRSRNPYGYIKHNVPPGFSMISNPLNTRDNTLNGLLSDVPADTQFLKWNESQQTYESYYFDTVDGWLPNATLLPGEGGFIFNATATPFTVTFIGEVLQGYLTKAIPAGVSIRGSLVPQAGGITSLLGFGTEDGLAHGDRIDRYNNGLYDIYQYLSGNWYRTTPSPTVLLEPQPAIAESVWFNVGGSRNWKRTFSVWP